MHTSYCDDDAYLRKHNSNDHDGDTAAIHVLSLHLYREVQVNFIDLRDSNLSGIEL